MDLGNPLTSIASLPVARVLRVLGKTTRPMSGRQISQMLGDRSASPAWRALADLREQGLVIADERRGATYWVANRDHLAWEAIQKLAGLREDLFDRMRREVESWEVRPLHVSVFGSTARGEAGPESDIDVLVLHRVFDPLVDDEDAWEEQLSELRAHVRAWTGNTCQTFALDTDRLAEYVRAGDALVENWLADEVPIAGRSLRSYVDRDGQP